MRLLMNDKECAEVAVGLRPIPRFMKLRLFIADVLIIISGFVHEWKYLFKYGKTPTKGIVYRLLGWLVNK
jgi:hypothetical protein